MKIDRREFVKAAGIASAAAIVPGSLAEAKCTPHAAPGTAHPAPHTPHQAQSRSLNILILGGTGLIGPHQVQYALARGHKVAVFNRGRRQPNLPSGVEQLLGDRNEPNGLAALKGRKWDVVFDNPTTLPKWVRAAGEVLKGATSHYIFTSTISVYPESMPFGANEDTPLLEYKGADAFAEAKVTGELYGPLKVVSEREAEKQFPGKTTIVRPGLIVGPGDESDRFTYWPVRIDRGGEVLAPGDGKDPIQIVDVRDLAEWMIRVAEQKVLGTFNATGPRSRLTSSEFLAGIRAAMPGSAEISFTWVPVEFLREQKVRPWSDMPAWLPNDSLSSVSIERAVKAGLTFRSLAVTAADTLAWFKEAFKKRPPERQAKMGAGLTAEREAEVLKAWHQKGSGTRGRGPGDRG